MSKHLLSKSTFIRGQQCQKSLYLHKKRPFLRDKLGPEQLAKFKRGTDIGILARDLFPGGIDMSPKSPAQYQKMRDATADALLNNDINIIYEAVFQHDDVLIMLDILVRNGNQWHAYEVKSSRSISETYIKDAALQYYVLSASGINLSGFSLIYINENYVFSTHLDLSGLFRIQDVSDEVKALKATIQQQIAISKESLMLQSSPEIQIGQQCFNPYPCDFKGHCWKNVGKDSVLNLRSLDLNDRFELYDKGIFSIQQLPDSYLKQNEISLEIQAFTSGTLIYDNEKLEAIKNFYSPYYTRIAYFKLITTESALPLIEATRPYTPLPLAFASLVAGSDQAEVVFIDQSKESIRQFLENFAGFLQEHEFIITDEVDTLLNSFHRLSEAYPSMKHWEAELLKKTRGINQLMESCSIFHPKFSDKFDLAVVGEVITNKAIKLTHTLYITKDILAAEHPNDFETPTNKLQQYVKVIQSVFNFFAAN